MDALIDIYREVKRTRDGIRPVQHGTDGHPVRLILKQEQLVHNNVNVTGRPDTNRGPGVSGLAVLLQPSIPSIYSKGCHTIKNFFLSLWCYWGEKFPG